MAVSADEDGRRVPRLSLAGASAPARSRVSMIAGVALYVAVQCTGVPSLATNRAT